MSQESKTIVLIHGLWMTPRSLDLFRGFYEQLGYRVLVPAWPRLAGEVPAIRQNPSLLAGLGIVEIADHYERIIRALDAPPILIGHSLGGLIVQMLLDRCLGRAGVAIDAPVSKGIFRTPFSVPRAFYPMLSNPMNYRRIVALTFEQFWATFANTMPASEARLVFERQIIPGPGRVFFQAAFSNLVPNASATINRMNGRRAPLLLIAGADDNWAPPALSRINYEKYACSAATTSYKEFPHRSHLLVLQDGWREIAAYALSWAQARSGESGFVTWHSWLCNRADPSKKTAPTSRQTPSSVDIEETVLTRSA